MGFNRKNNELAQLCFLSHHIGLLVGSLGYQGNYNFFNLFRFAWILWKCKNCQLVFSSKFYVLPFTKIKLWKLSEVKAIRDNLK